MGRIRWRPADGSQQTAEGHEVRPESEEAAAARFPNFVAYATKVRRENHTPCRFVNGQTGFLQFKSCVPVAGVPADLQNELHLSKR